MQKLKPWLLLGLVFFAGFAGGVVASHIAMYRFIHRAVNSPEYLRERIEGRMAVKLRLTTEQRAKAHETLVKAHHDLQQLRAGFQPQFLAIFERAHAEIASTLTPEQLKKFEDFKEENRHLWEPH